MDKILHSNVARLIMNRNKVLEYPVVFSCDAHTESVYVFAVDTRTGEIIMDKNIAGGIKQCIKEIQKSKTDKKEIIILYEAGCLGYSLYRKLNEAGIRCKVIAPVSIPRQYGKKTDRTDAINNFEYYCSGLLRFVTVPDAGMEMLRESLRYRYQLVWERTAEKQKVQALFKRYGITYTLTKKAWTKKFYAWVAQVAVSEEVRLVLDMRMQQIERYDSAIAQIDERLLKRIVAHERYQTLYEGYISITGIGPLGAMTWVIEGGDLNRFSHPHNLMSYLGLIPKKNSSAGKDPSMSITKAGNAYLRYVTVCAARCYSDRRLTQRIDALSQYTKPVAEMVKRAQDRLCTRYQHLRKNKKNSNKAKVAIARELCGFVWEMAVRIIPQTQHAQEKKAA